MPASDGSSILGTECSDRSTIHDDIRALILQNHYPCVAAIQSVVRNDHVIATYDQFGRGTVARQHGSEDTADEAVAHRQRRHLVCSAFT